MGIEIFLVRRKVVSTFVNRIPAEEFLERLKGNSKSWVGIVDSPHISGIALVVPDGTGQEVVYLGPDPLTMETPDYRQFVDEAWRIGAMPDAEREKKASDTPDWFHVYVAPSIDVDLVAEAIRISPDDMFIPPGGQRVYFLSNRPEVTVFRVDALEGDNFHTASGPEEIREHVRLRLREAGLGDFGI